MSSKHTDDDHPSTWVPVGGTNRRSNSSSVSAPLVLDLHGLTGEQAIRRLVQFLWTHQQQPKETPQTRGLTSASIVHVITGVGRHSNSTGGPVIKPTVSSFLHRHGFEHCCTGGCFAIAIDTGSLSYGLPSCPVSTKLHIVPSSSPLQQRRTKSVSSSWPSTITQRNVTTAATGGHIKKPLDGIGQSRLSSLPSPLLGTLSHGTQRHVSTGPRLTTTARSLLNDTHKLREGSESFLVRDDEMPSLSVVASDEAAVAHVQEKSLLEHQSHQRQVAAAHREDMQQALALSLLQYGRDSQQQQPTNTEEEDQLQEAYRQSAEWSVSQQQDEDAMIQQVLALSATATITDSSDRMLNETDDEYRAMLQMALQESAELEASEREEEDALIQQALALSVQEMRQPCDDSIFQEISQLTETMQCDFEADDTEAKLPAVVTDKASLTRQQSLLSSPAQMLSTNNTTMHCNQPVKWKRCEEDRGTLETSNRENDLLMKHVLSLSENVAWKSSEIEDVPGPRGTRCGDENCQATKDDEQSSFSVKLLHYVDDTMVVVTRGDYDNDDDPGEECLERMVAGASSSMCQDKQLLLRLLSQSGGDHDRRQRRGNVHNRR